MCGRVQASKEWGCPQGGALEGPGGREGLKPGSHLSLGPLGSLSPWSTLRSRAGFPETARCRGGEATQAVSEAWHPSSIEKLSKPCHKKRLFVAVGRVEAVE